MKYILDKNEYELRKEQLESKGKNFELYTMDSNMIDRINISLEDNDRKIVIEIMHSENVMFIHFDDRFRLTISGTNVNNENTIKFKISSFGSGNTIKDFSCSYGDRIAKPKYFYLPIGYILTIFFSNNIKIDKKNIEITVDTELLI